jgi:[NiFe] hydrogenase assembly HybE family chaperone
MSSAFEGSYNGDGSKIADDTRLECGVCWWVYDPALGDEETQTPPNTPFRLLPDTWECPNCATHKSKFMVVDSATLTEDDAVNNLANAYRRAALKVKGLPIYNPTIAIEAVGFREFEGRQVGVMLTPWFMNLVALPTADDLTTWKKDGAIRLAFPSGAYDFVVTELHDVGLIGSCSLFSTMTEFTDHEAAQLAATSVAEAVFQAEAPPPPPTVSRRQLLGG